MNEETLKLLAAVCGMLIAAGLSYEQAKARRIRKACRLAVTLAAVAVLLSVSALAVIFLTQ
jgi:hypothetical protein